MLGEVRALDPGYLRERKRAVLGAVVELYTATAQPVSSRAVSEALQGRWSPATVRNVFTVLDEEGLTWQPHASAGRVPTEEGYRFYVREVMESPSLDRETSGRIRAGLGAGGSSEELLDAASRLLASALHQMSVVMGPPMGRCTVAEVRALRAGPHRAIVTLVTQTGLARSHVVGISEELTDGQMEEIAAELSEVLSGLTVDDVRRLSEEFIAGRCPREEFVSTLLELAAACTGEPIPFFVRGAGELLSQPEFSSAGEAAGGLLGLIEERSALLPALASPGGRLWVRIGSENLHPYFGRCGVVSTGYYFGRDSLGTISVIGPTRMDYSRAIALVSEVASVLSEMLGRGA